MSTIAAKLDSVSWDFSQSKTSRGLHGIHPYPAKFIPELPHALIQLFHPGDDSPVLDPFCGSGTTLVESSNLGLPAIGIDLHPLATLIAKVKTTPLTCSLHNVAEEVSEHAKRLAGSPKLEIPDIPRLDHWFRHDIQTALAATITLINELDDEDTRDALKVALSSIIVRVSNQESDTRYAAIEKNLAQDNVWSLFMRSASMISDSLLDVYGNAPHTKPSVRLINKDLMQVAPRSIGKNVGLVVTSPPYPNAYEYWLYHKYRMYWLGMDPIAVREAEIGARPHYFKKNHQTEDDFERQMEKCFLLLSKTMKSSAYACFIVGRSIIHGRTIDNEALLERAGGVHGFLKVGSVQRQIAASRKSFNLTHGRINKEAVIIFQSGAK